MSATCPSAEGRSGRRHQHRRGLESRLRSHRARQGQVAGTPRTSSPSSEREAAKPEPVYLATDPDREGEAIAWHLEDALGLEDAADLPHHLQRDHARRPCRQPSPTPARSTWTASTPRKRAAFLDRVVGYPLSGLLSRKVARSSSAGRVQSVALRLVVDREREIEAFKPEEYWKITALLAPAGARADSLSHAVELGRDQGRRGQGRGRPRRSGQDKAAKAAQARHCRPAPSWPNWPNGPARSSRSRSPGSKRSGIAAACSIRRTTAVTKVEQKDRQEKAPPPFTTSTLQQQANLRLHFTADRTMQTAQRLYEGVIWAAKARWPSSPTCVPTARASPTRH